MADLLPDPRSRPDRLRDPFAALVMGAIALAVTATLGWILLDLLRFGLGGLSWEFLTTSPRDAGRAGGIGPMVVSTLWILGICLAVAVPLGVGCAAYLAEFTRRDAPLGIFVRRSLDLLAAVPSIVFGLFGMVLFSQVLGLGFSILAGGLTLACMVLPILIRSTEAGLRAVPDDMRRGAAALGLSRRATLRHLLLPAAVPGVLVGLVLGIGRALAETAALLFTSGYVTRMPSSWLDSGRALSVHIYDLAMNVPGGEANAYSTALVLLVLLLAIHGAAGWVADRRRISSE
jgi:phosphate transport system permease protein